MAFLNIGAVSTIPCVNRDGTANESEVGGADVRAFAGNLRSTVRWTKRVWQVTTVALPAADANAIIAAIAARPVNVSGDITGGATVPCIVTLTGGPYRRSWANVIKRSLSLTIREV